MKNKIDELTRAAAGDEPRVSVLLRRARELASKLGAQEQLRQFERELGGYDVPANVPPYRVVPAMIYFMSPRSRGPFPVDLGDDKMNRDLHTIGIVHGVGEIESLIASSSNSRLLYMRIPNGLENMLLKMAGAQALTLHWQFTTSSLSAILDSIRDDIHRWCLSLGGDSVRGVSATSPIDLQTLRQALALKIQNVNVYGNLGALLNDSGVAQGAVSGPSANVGTNSGTINGGTDADTVSQDAFEKDVTAILHALVDRIETVEASTIQAMKALKCLNVDGQELRAVAQMVEDLWIKHTGETFKTFSQRMVDGLGPGVTRSFISTGLWKILGLAPQLVV